jgi:hypothetical protein
MSEPLKATPQPQGEVLAGLSSMCTNNFTILRFYELRLRDHCALSEIENSACIDE